MLPPPPAHPRRCGADGDGAHCVSLSPGSSPQVRGRLRGTAAGVLGGGLIPAGAGQTTAWRTTFSLFAAHPRRCGADRRSPARRRLVRGSSPQVRGRQRAQRREEKMHGLIPAGAGQTRSEVAAANAAPAHPRRCGADADAAFLRASARGSSPQVRGRLVADPARELIPRLIPAGAGQTGRHRTRTILSRAHPRRCGADTTPCSSTRVESGSSPQVRGRLDYKVDHITRKGLIPAGAGQTLVDDLLFPRQPAHPRRCGADSAPVIYILHVWGSSPQVRGRPSYRAKRRADAGLIPAGAGQTTACFSPVR